MVIHPNFWSFISNPKQEGENRIKDDQSQTQPIHKVMLVGVRVGFASFFFEIKPDVKKQNKGSNHICIIKVAVQWVLKK